MLIIVNSLSLQAQTQIKLGQIGTQVKLGDISFPVKDKLELVQKNGNIQMFSTPTIILGKEQIPIGAPKLIKELKNPRGYEFNTKGITDLWIRDTTEMVNFTRSALTKIIPLKFSKITSTTRYFVNDKKEIEAGPSTLKHLPRNIDYFFVSSWLLALFLVFSLSLFNIYGYVTSSLENKKPTKTFLERGGLLKGYVAIIASAFLVALIAELNLGLVWSTVAGVVLSFLSGLAAGIFIRKNNRAVTMHGSIWVGVIAGIFLAIINGLIIEPLIKTHESLATAWGYAFSLTLICIFSFVLREYRISRLTRKIIQGTAKREKF